MSQSVRAYGGREIANGSAMGGATVRRYHHTQALAGRLILNLTGQLKSGSLMGG